MMKYIKSDYDLRWSDIYNIMDSSEETIYK